MLEGLGQKQLKVSFLGILKNQPYSMGEPLRTKLMRWHLLLTLIGKKNLWLMTDRVSSTIATTFRSWLLVGKQQGL